MISLHDYEQFIKNLKKSIKEGNNYIISAQDSRWFSIVKERDPESLIGTGYGFLLTEDTDFEGVYDTYIHNFAHTTLYIAPVKVTETPLKKVKVTDMGILHLEDYYDVIRNLYLMETPEGCTEDPLKTSDLIQCTFHISNLPRFKKISSDLILY